MTQNRLRAITTRYKGYAFRSRLEARWAVFFDHLEIRWEYEPEGFELGNGLRYLPDFWLPDWKIWVEVKPGPPDDVAKEKAWRLARLSGHAVFMTNGMPDRAGTILFTVDVASDSMDDEIHGYLDFKAADYGPRAWGFSNDKPIGFVECQQNLGIYCFPYNAERAKDPIPVPQDALAAARSARFEFGQEGVTA